VDKNTTVVFPAPLMSTIGDLADFLGRESSSAAKQNGRNLVAPAQDLVVPPQDLTVPAQPLL
jgi:hypothetical protein